jgi:hypothetical protein
MSSQVPISGIALTTILSAAVNDKDTVVFTARYNDGSYPGAQGVFAPNRVLLKKGDVVRGLTVTYPAVWGVNDFDELAITFSYGNGLYSALGKFVWKGDRLVPEGKLIQHGDIIDGLTIEFFRECAINDMGEIVFSADYVDSSGNTGTGVFTRNRVLLKTGSVVDGVTISGNNYFDHLSGWSDLGTFVFDTFGTLPNLGTSQTGAFTRHKELAAPGETIDGIPLFTALNPQISHFDRKAFSGTYSINPSCYLYSCQGSAAFTHNHVVAKTGDTISGTTLTGVTAAGINDDGTVLLLDNFAGGYGLFTKDSAIVLTTDTIDGNPVEGIASSAINDCGNVVSNTNLVVVLAKRKTATANFSKR